MWSYATERSHVSSGENPGEAVVLNLMSDYESRHPISNCQIVDLIFSIIPPDSSLLSISWGARNSAANARFICCHQFFNLDTAAKRSARDVKCSNSARQNANCRESSRLLLDKKLGISALV